MVCAPAWSICGAQKRFSNDAPMAPLLSSLLIFFALGVYGLVHSWLASLQAKRWARRLLGDLPVDRYYRLAYNLFAVVSLLPVMAMVTLLPDRPLYVIPFPWVMLTLAVQGLAVLALLVGLLQTGVMDFLGLRQLVVSSRGGNGQLVKDGLYRWVRHPLYTAGLVFIWFSPVMSTNLLAFFAGLSAYLVIGAYFEERKLILVYGDAYRRIQQNTPMFIPRTFGPPASKE